MCPTQITWEHEHVEGNLPEGMVAMERLSGLLEPLWVSDG